MNGPEYAEYWDSASKQASLRRYFQAERIDNRIESMR